MNVEFSPYGARNHLVLFKNITLPNDCFKYTREYYVDPSSSQYDHLQCEAMHEVVEHIADVLKIPDEAMMEVNGHVWEGRFELYFWTDSRSKCTTVKFEYGSYEMSTNKKAYSRASLRILLANVEKNK